MKATTFLFVLLFIHPFFSKGQIGINTTMPNATLDIVASASALDNDGVLIPRVTQLSTTETAAQDGMLVFLTTDWFDGVTTYSRGFYFWNALLSQWSIFITAVNEKSFVAGDVKTGLQTADHNGWYLLDGRAIGTLPANAQAAAITLGFATNLSNATNRVLKQDASLGSTGGSNTVSILQANLPNVNFTGSTSPDGSHTHTGTANLAGNHNHSASTSTAGSHNHAFYTATNDVNNSTSQGYPAGNNHIAFRTTDRRQQTRDNGTILANGNHTHSVTVNTNGNHSHSLSINISPTHTHSIFLNSGGSGTPLSITPAYLGVNMFIYLGL